MKKSSKKRLYNIIIIVSAVVLLIGLSVLFNWFSQSKNAENEIENINPFSVTEQSESENDDKTKDIKNCVAWLKIDGTNIDYPVMQKSGSPEYYLRRNYKGEYSYSGTPFLDIDCKIGTSQNLIIYGHNMKDGTMFSGLTKFKNSSYAKEHQTIKLYVNGEVTEYKLYAVCVVSSDDGWYDYTNQVSEDTFTELKSHIQNKSSYTADSTAEYGDYFLTLSTCDYTQSNGRLIIIAVKS